MTYKLSFIKLVFTLLTCFVFLIVVFISTIVNCYHALLFCFLLLCCRAFASLSVKVFLKVLKKYSYISAYYSLRPLQLNVSNPNRLHICCLENTPFLLRMNDLNHSLTEWVYPSTFAHSYELHWADWEMNGSFQEVIQFKLFTQKICAFEGNVCDFTTLIETVAQPKKSHRPAEESQIKFWQEMKK